MKFKNVQNVAEWRLCTGCGVCAYVCPEKKITLVNFINDGIRPVLSVNSCSDCHDCIDVCPGYETVHLSSEKPVTFIPELNKTFGPLIEVWEGYAADPDMRYYGSSGGVASALALFCIEKEGMYGLLHAASSKTNPLENETVFSQNRSDILSRTGSRYSPASPAEGLRYIETAPASCVFIGKPCDIVGLRKTQGLRHELNDKIGVTIGIFCAGTPATIGTMEMLRNLDIDHVKVDEIRYRGKGWPGMFSVRQKSNEKPSLQITYNEAWGFIQKYRPFRCYLCPDGTSEFADISCGDPWYRTIKKGESGHSLIVVRTEKGRKILDGAIANGYVVANKASPVILEVSQKNLIAKRGAIWGRLVMMAALGIPAPKLYGFSLFKNWYHVPAKDKIKSVFGTAKRIIQRKYYKPSNLT